MREARLEGALCASNLGNFWGFIVRSISFDVSEAEFIGIGDALLSVGIPIYSTAHAALDRLSVNRFALSISRY